jgi:hypothetical protein
VYELITSDEAVADIEEILVEAEEAGLRIFALLEQLETDQDLLDRLCQDGYGGSPKRPVRGAIINIGKWVMAQRKGMNLWRMRDFELSKMGFEYRIIYAFNPRDSQYVILAIAKREFDYEESHPITQRVFAAYSRIESEQW